MSNKRPEDMTLEEFFEYIRVQNEDGEVLKTNPYSHEVLKIIQEKGFSFYRSYQRGQKRLLANIYSQDALLNMNVGQKFCLVSPKGAYTFELKEIMPLGDGTNPSTEREDDNERTK